VFVARLLERRVFAERAAELRLRVLVVFLPVLLLLGDLVPCRDPPDFFMVIWILLIEQKLFSYQLALGHQGCARLSRRSDVKRATERGRAMCFGKRREEELSIMADSELPIRPGEAGSRVLL
jgi:hypothetical protein